MLATNLIDRTKDVEAQTRFAAGLQNHIRAHALARAEIERAFAA